MSEYWETRPRRARIQQWKDAHEPPEGVHDVWFNGSEGITMGWLDRPTTEALVYCGQYVLTWLDTGERDVLEYRDVQDRFVRVVAEEE